MRLDGQKTWLEIDAQAYKNNLIVLKSLLRKDVTFCAVVKANAYGHGINNIVKLALSEGINHFAVDSIDEALQVKLIAPQATIFILGYTVPERLRDIITNSFIQTVYTIETIQILGDEARRQNKPALINIKIETGTQRQGIELSNLKILLSSIDKEKGSIKCVGMSSHFSSPAILSKKDVIIEQDIIFNQAIKLIAEWGIDLKYKHISCSASALLYPETHHTMVRFGLAQYGLWPSEDIRTKILLGAQNINLKAILTWKTRIAQIKEITTNTPVGYGQCFISDRPMRIAILPIGYYDGYRRILNKSYVLLHGQKCSILGNICMNMMIINVSHIGQAKIDDEVTLIGRDGMNSITAEDLAIYADTINYEITTMINPLTKSIVK